MTKLKDLTLEEQREFGELLYTWLQSWVERVGTEVIIKHAEQIYNNDGDMELLREYKRRKDIENENRAEAYTDKIRGFYTYGHDSEIFYLKENAEAYKTVLDEKYVLPIIHRY